jgi:hypothetical protein
MRILRHAGGAFDVPQRRDFSGDGTKKRLL